MKRQLWEFAAQLGFDRMRVCPLPDYTQWRRRVESMPDAHFSHLTDNVDAMLPGATCAVLLAWAYRPYENPADGATVSAYYPASDDARKAVDEVENWLCQRGFRAKSAPNIPLKPAAVQGGLAKYGRNGVTAIDGLGSRYSLQLVLTDAPLEMDQQALSPVTLSDNCANCGRCVKACPVGALDGTGRVDVKKCIRARSDEYPLDEAYRPLIGRSLYGCDICQDVCPRNEGVSRQPMPEKLQNALRLETLLAGDVAGLVPYIGKNYARKARMQAKACVIAANMGRKDLLEAVQACENSPVDFVRAHARWAVEQLKK